MQVLPFGRSGLVQTALVPLLTLAAAALLGAVLAYWTWAWFAPRAEPRLEATAQTGSVASASAIFGKVPRKQAAAAPTGIAIKLFGIVAASEGRRGYAVVQLEAKQILAVHEGEDIAPGVRLAEVRRDHLILERNGVREKLAWPERSAPPSPQAAQPSAQQARQVRAAQSSAATAARPAARRSGRAARRRDDSE